MSTIRRQSIISSGIVYFGFALGFLNTYLFAREGGFTPQQYGLTGIFTAIASLMYSFANLGMPFYIYKFYPYYRDNLEPTENDMFTWALITSMVGFVLVMVGGYVFKDFVIYQYGKNSPELIQYYNLLLPFGFGLTLYSLLEALAWQFRRSVVTNFLREVLFRVLTTVLILLSFAGVIMNFDIFIRIYAFTYIMIALILLGYMLYKGNLPLALKPSRVSKKFRRKILTMVGLVWGGSLVFNISQVFDSLIIGSVMEDGLAFVAVYTLAQNMSSLVQAPQRAIVSTSIAALAQAWKDKDMKRIDLIYHRSSINLLLFSVAMFVLIWINFTDGVLTFHLKKTFLDAQYVFLFIGLMRVIDLGTGVNSQIIGTSTYWRFDFYTGIILLAITLPLNYLLTINIGIIGPAIANLFALIVYNAIRYVFLLRKFNLQPFSVKTLYVLGLGLSGYLVSHLLFNHQQGFLWIVLRSSVFLAIYVTGALMFKVSPDIIPVWQTLKKKVGIK